MIKNTLDRLNVSDCQPAPIPYCYGLSLTTADPREAILSSDKYPYVQGIGCLRYTAEPIRPDITFMTNILAWNIHKPTIRHWHYFKRVLRYLKGTISYGILYPKNPQPLISYSDADYEACTGTRRSTSGSIHLLNGAPVHWSCKRQVHVAPSTCEAEYIAACYTIQPTKWLRYILRELDFQGTVPSKLAVDNQDAIKMGLSAGPKKRSKYVDIRHHYLREALDNDTEKLAYVPTTTVLADSLTKTYRESN